MFLTDVNDVKIYNLSCGKSLPDWLTDRKRRSLLKKNVELRRRIELIQDFDMPGVSTTVRISPDNQFIVATGTYKPRVKCYDVNNLAMKFERCLDADVVTFEILSEDYSKLVFLHCDRFIEFHVGHGRHYRLRIPRFGNDMSYHKPTCDLFFVGTSPDIYRLNLERGQFLQPFTSSASYINTSEVNPEHQLLCVGTKEGTVEAWDPRDRKKCATLDVAISLKDYKNFPSVTAINFKNGLQMGVGTASGQVLVYDIRSSEPIIVKDHLNQLPIKKINFNNNLNYVYSMDSAMMKIWDESNGKQVAFIESINGFNDFVAYPNSGMFFFAQEDIKMQTYYIPSLGPAPRWCSFLDNLTEEIESETVQNIYDDYKFITKQELQDFDLEHLVGTNLLKAYMHGYFVDIRLYNKAKAAADPFAYERYRKEKIRKHIDASIPKRVQIQSNLPKVNKDIAMKLMEEKNTKTNKKSATSLLDDNRFKAMFENPDFEIDKSTEEYRLLTPALGRLSNTKKKIKKIEDMELYPQFEEVPNNDKNSDDELFSGGDGADDSSDEEDDREYAKQMKKQHKIIKKERYEKDQQEEEEKAAAEVAESENSVKNPKMFEIRSGEEYKIKAVHKKLNKASLGERIMKSSEPKVSTMGSLGNRQMTFSSGKDTSKAMKRRADEMRKHRDERKQLMRSTKGLGLKRINR